MSHHAAMKKEESTASHDSPHITSIHVLLARVLWAFVGPMFLLLLTYKIIISHGWFTPWDAAFGVLALFILAGRWIEQRSGQATTMFGDPSTARDFHRYIVIMLVITGVIWLGANIVSNHILAVMK